jgi:hypothetical protein
MSDHCFKKDESSSPICGVHGVVLVVTQISIDNHAPSLGEVSVLKCPVSQTIVWDNPKFRPQK